MRRARGTKEHVGDIGLKAWFQADISRWKRLSPLVKVALSKHNPDRIKPVEVYTRKGVVLGIAVSKRRREDSALMMRSGRMPVEKERQILAFKALRRQMDELFAEVDKAQRELDLLARRDGVDLSPKALMKLTEGIYLQADTGAALKALRAAERKAGEFHDTVYVKERDAMTAAGLLKPRPRKARH